MESTISAKSAAELLVETLSQKHLRIAVSEAGTGGMLAQEISGVPGANMVFRCGAVVFDQSGMSAMAGVRKSVARKYGLGQKEAAVAMAYGIRQKDKACVGVGISGNPDGQAEKPMYAAVCLKNGSKNWIAVSEITPAPGEELTAFRQRAVDEILRLIYGYFVSEQKSLLAFGSMKPYRRLCSAPLPIKILQFFIPWAGDGAGDVTVKLLLIAAILAGGWAVTQLSADAVTDYNTVKVIERAVETLEKEPTVEQVSGLPEGYLPKFAAAYEINPELVGWLTIPNTNMNLPVLQHKDNEYYLKHNFENESDINGAPFMDFRNAITPELDTNTLVYGHNMESGVMFHSLLNYENLDFYKQNPVITFDSVYEESQWKVISCFEATTDANVGEVFEYFNFVKTKNTERIQWYMDEIKARSFFNTTVDVNTDDSFLTLQTCKNDRYNTKVCVVARKVRPGETSEVDVENAVTNPARVPASRY